MKPIILLGISLVVLALGCYTIGFVTEQRDRRISAGVLGFLVVGVVLDLTATLCMILGTSRSLLTPHGLIGFSALAAMLALTVVAARHRGRNADAEVSGWLHTFARLAYGFWIVAFVSGAALVAAQRAAARHAALLS